MSQTTPDRAPPPWRVHPPLIAVQFLFASISVFGKEAMQSLAWPLFVAVRVSASAALFWLLGGLLGRRPVARRDHLPLALYGLLGVAANQALFLAGLSRTKAIHASVLGTSIPVFATTLAGLLGRERLTTQKGAGVLLALAGALGLILFSARPSAPSAAEAALSGNLLILTNSLCYALYLVLSKDLLKRYDATTVASWMFVYGLLEVMAFEALAALLDPAAAREALSGAALAPPSAWLMAAYVIAATVTAYWLNSWALRHAATSLVAIYIYLQPLVATLLAMLRLGETLSPREVLAAALILGGVTLVGRARPKGPGG